MCFKETFRELAQLLSTELPSGGSVLWHLVNGYLSKSAEPVSVASGAQSLSSQLIKPGMSGHKALRTGRSSIVSEVVISSTSSSCDDEITVVTVNHFSQTAQN